MSFPDSFCQREMSPTLEDSTTSEQSAITSSTAEMESVYDMACNYQLRSEVLHLVSQYEKVERNEMKKNDLSRLLLHSSVLRASLAEGNVKMVQLMIAHPENITNCLKVSFKLAELVKLSSSGNFEECAFSFTRLPFEIRRMIYNLTLKNNALVDMSVCQNHCDTREGCLKLHRAEKTIFQLDHDTRMEALAVFFEVNVFAFACTCALADFFASYPESVTLNLRSVILSWKGKHRISGIKGLTKLPNLQNFALCLHRNTTHEVVERERLIREHFGAPISRAVRFVDSVGFDELLQIKHLKQIHVEYDKYVGFNARLKEEAQKMMSYLEPIVCRAAIEEIEEEEEGHKSGSDEEANVNVDEARKTKKTKKQIRQAARVMKKRKNVKLIVATVGDVPRILPAALTKGRKLLPGTLEYITAEYSYHLV